MARAGEEGAPTDTCIAAASSTLCHLLRLWQGRVTAVRAAAVRDMASPHPTLAPVHHPQYTGDLLPRDGDGNPMPHSDYVDACRALDPLPWYDDKGSRGLGPPAGASIVATTIRFGGAVSAAWVTRAFSCAELVMRVPPGPAPAALVSAVRSLALRLHDPALLRRAAAVLGASARVGGVQAGTQSAPVGTLDVSQWAMAEADVADLVRWVTEWCTTARQPPLALLRVGSEWAPWPSSLTQLLLTRLAGVPREAVPSRVVVCGFHVPLRALAASTRGGLIVNPATLAHADAAVALVVAGCGRGLRHVTVWNAEAAAQPTCCCDQWPWLSQLCEAASRGGEVATVRVVEVHGSSLPAAAHASHETVEEPPGMWPVDALPEAVLCAAGLELFDEVVRYEPPAPPPRPPARPGLV